MVLVSEVRTQLSAMSRAVKGLRSVDSASPFPSALQNEPIRIVTTPLNETGIIIKKLKYARADFRFHRFPHFGPISAGHKGKVYDITSMPAEVSEKIPASLSKAVPEPGDVVKVRSRRYLVEAVEAAREPFWEQTLVELSCLEDDAQGEHLSVLWEREVDSPHYVTVENVTASVYRPENFPQFE